MRRRPGAVLAASIAFIGFTGSAAGDLIRTNAFGLGADAEVREQDGGTEALGYQWELAARYWSGVHNQHMMIRFDLSGINEADILAGSPTTLQLYVNRNSWRTSPGTFQYYALKPEAANQLWEEPAVNFRTAPGLVYDGDMSTRGFTSDTTFVGELPFSGTKPPGTALDFQSQALTEVMLNALDYHKSHGGTPVVTMFVALKEGSPTGHNYVVKSRQADSAYGLGLLSGQQYDPQLIFPTLPTANVNSTWIAAGAGSWDQASNWSPSIVPQNSDTQKFDVCYSPDIYRELDLPIDVTIDRLSITGGPIRAVGARKLTVNRRLDLATGHVFYSLNGTQSNPEDFIIESHGELSIRGDVGVTGSHIHNHGQAVQSAEGEFKSSGQFTNHLGATYEIQGNSVIDCGTFINQGTLRKTGGGTSRLARTVVNSGTVLVEAGTMLLGGESIWEPSRYGGVYAVSPGATFLFTGGTIREDAVVRCAGILTTAGTTDFFGTLDNTGPLEVPKRGVNQAVLNFKAGSALNSICSEAYVGNSCVLSFDTGKPIHLPKVRLEYGELFGSDPIVIDGELAGYGYISANCTLLGRVSPGAPYGRLHFLAPVTFADSSELHLELTSSLMDFIYADRASVSLDGLLVVDWRDSLFPPPAASYTMLDARDPLVGTFNNVLPGGRLQLLGGQGSFRIDYGPGSPYGANKVVLSAFQVPEPTLSAAGLLVGALVLRRR